MPYVVSKLANSQTYTKYKKGTDNKINVVVASVTILGGADVANKKNLITPSGVVTEVTENELQILKENKDFQKHLEKGFINIFAHEPKVDKVTETMSKDKSKQLTKDDYEKEGKKAPKVAKEA